MIKKLSILLFGLLVACGSDDSNPVPTDDDNAMPTDDTIDPTGELMFSEGWESETAPFLPQGLVYDTSNEPYFYLAAKGGGILVFEDSESGDATEVANIPIGDLAELHAMNVAKQGNHLYVALGDFFGDNSKAGLGIIDVSDPVAPVVMDIWESEEILGGSAIVAVQGDYAYLGAMKEGVFIFDVSNPNSIPNPVVYQPDINFPLENPGDVAHPNARGMDIDGNLLYLCYDAGGIRVIDVSDKENPTEIGRYLNDTAQENTPKAYNNILIHGSYGYIAVDYCGFEIIDISNPEDPIMVGWWNPWECDSLSNIWLNSPGHTNQMGYDAQNQLLFVSTGKSELGVLDVSDPANPTLAASFGTPDNTLATWGITLNGSDVYMLYVAAAVPLYSNWSGLKKLSWEIN